MQRALVLVPGFLVLFLFGTLGANSSSTQQSALR